MNPVNENQSISEWVNAMLTRRGLDKPDGRQLYQYRLTAVEFGELKNYLEQYLSVGMSLSGLAKRSRFPSLFVLYGAEWWRRRYDGSGFSWDGILRDIGANADEWNQAQRSECVRTGLQTWGLRTLEGSGFRFLGSVALQGGLPMKALAEARGGIGYLLGRVLRSANNRLVDPLDIQNWVKDLQNLLPKSYRQPAIFILLADIAWKVIEFKRIANLDSGENAIALLTAKIPDWREQFPLPIEDSQARSLIEQLVREAASVRLPKATVCLPVERFLEKSAGEGWKLSSSVDLPDTIEVEKLAKLFAAEAEDLPRFAELSIAAGGQTRTAAIRKLAGNPKFRVEGRTWNFSDAAALNEHLLKLTAADGRVWTTSAMKGLPLEDDLPWIFSVEDAVNQFVRQGAGGVAGNKALIALPNDWKISEHSKNAAEKVGVLPEFSRDIYLVNETVFVDNAAGAASKIKLQSQEETNESFEWRGRRWWLDFLNPSIAFRGKPNLFSVGADGNAVKINGAITCQAIGAANSNQWLGPVTLAYSNGGELKHKSRMTLLPEDAQFSLKFGDALSGAIVFKSWGLSRVIVKTPDVNFTQQTEGDALILQLSVPPELQAPAQVTVELFWRHTATPARLVVPFPSKGTRAFDKDGRELDNDSLLSLNRLLGIRLNVLGGAAQKIKLKLQTTKGGLDRRYFLQTLPGTVSLEVRLSDYLTDINHLLSLDDSPDSKVKITLSINNEESFALNVARYESLIERGAENVLMRIKGYAANDPQIKELPVLAVRLEDPNEEPEILPFGDELSEEKFQWLFSPSNRKPGAWLVYPGADAEIAFRPTLWTVANELEEIADESELARAINLSDEAARKKALDQLIGQMAEDFANPAWEEISRLAEIVGHLPLTTLDVWRRFSRSATGMAALAFRYGKLPNGFVSRFENELPFAWETIPFAVWKKAIEKSHEYCCGLFGEEVGKTIFDAHAKRRIGILDARHGGLSFLLGIASKDFFPESQLELLRLVGEDLAKNQLFIGDNSRLMNLRRIHFEDLWVTDADDLLGERWKNPKVQSFLCADDYRKQNHVINLPLLLAAETATGGSISWLKNPAKIHLLRTFRAFDAEWFDEAFNWTIVRCLANGLLDD